MKTLCVAVIVLSLTSVCQPAPLACEKLLKPVDKVPDLTGSWYVIAMSTDTCLVTTLLNSVFWPSAAVDMTSTDKPNVYNSNTKVKMYGHCETDSEDFFLENNTMFEVDRNNAPTGTLDVLLQTGCPDCIVLKDLDILDTFWLMSRRKTVTNAELKEFETQAECNGFSKPQVFNSDHDYENCLPMDDDDIDSSRILPLIYQRVKSTYTVPLQCFAETILYYPKAAFEWTKQQWATLWFLVVLYSAFYSKYSFRQSNIITNNY